MGKKQNLWANNSALLFQAGRAIKKQEAGEGRDGDTLSTSEGLGQVEDRRADCPHSGSQRAAPAGDPRRPHGPGDTGRGSLRMRRSVSGGQWGRRDLGRGNGICKVWGHEGMKSVLGRVRSTKWLGSGGVSGQVRGVVWTVGIPSIPAGVERTSPHESWRRDPEIAPCVRFLAVLQRPNRYKSMGSTHQSSPEINPWFRDKNSD